MIYPESLPPVVVLAKDRIRYLDTTLKSLFASLPKNVTIYVSCDSPSEDVIQYLTTNQMININGYEYPDNEWWMNKIGLLNNKTTFGISGRIRIIIHKSGTKGLGLTFNKVAELHPRATHIIRVEDDVIFKINWYQKMLNAFRHKDIGIISGLRHFYNNVKFKNYSDDLEELIEGYTGGVNLGISRKMCPFLLSNVKTINDNDDFWINQCRSINLKICVFKKGICQHIGVISGIYGDKKQYKDRVDHNVEKPFATSSQETIGVSLFKSDILFLD